MPSLLVDVRSAEEYMDGYLKGAINIPYQDIDQLPTQHPNLSKQDVITLYCHSGRRSAIALEALQVLGFVNARDVGGLDAARETLSAEEKGKQGRLRSPVLQGTGYDKAFLESSGQKLLDDLRALE